MSAIDETITSKMEYYDPVKYKNEIAEFVRGKRLDLDITSNMKKNYERLYRSVFAGSEESDTERFTQAAETYKVYKSALIEACLQGYSALLEVSGNDGYSTLKTPELKKVMTNQFKDISLLENLSGETLDDWTLKGEAAAVVTLKENKEEYRIKTKLTDEITGEPVVKFDVKTGVSYDVTEVERIDPLDIFVDALDYKKDPLGCVKIIRSYIDAKTLLSSDAYPLLTSGQKADIISKNEKNGSVGYFSWTSMGDSASQYNKSDKHQIEVLTFYGDYVTNDNKVLNNIIAVLVGNEIANVKYNGVSTNKIIYAPYKVDRNTHRGISPLACTNPINKLANRATDLFLKNLDDVCNPWLMWQKGTMSATQVKEARRKKELEYLLPNAMPQFWAPQMAPMQGLELIKMVIDQCKNTLGLNNYMAGDTSGAVRTARESAILSQKANARMRVETDVFSYNFLLPLFRSFYAFNRELALVANRPQDPIYADPQLNVIISTNASRADKEGELQRLMQMLQLPIAQMIFSNLQPDQVVLAVRYLMAKAELTDGDNLLELVDGNNEPTTYIPEPEQGQVSDQVTDQVDGVPPTQEGGMA